MDHPSSIERCEESQMCRNLDANLRESSSQSSYRRNPKVSPLDLLSKRQKQRCKQRRLRSRHLRRKRFRQKELNLRLKERQLLSPYLDTKPWSLRKARRLWRPKTKSPNLCSLR